MTGGERVPGHPSKAGDLRILTEFLELPLESADAVFERFAALAGAVRRGRGAEQFLFVPGTRRDRVVLVAHADTYWDAGFRGDGRVRQALLQEHGRIRNEAGGLGADDRAGCAMIWLLKGLGHSILITSGEEQGGVGSSWLMEENADVAAVLNREHQFLVQFDRRNGRDFKCYSVGTDAFRSYLRRVTGYEEPDRRSFTDVVRLCREICGVNLSIGYHNEHHPDEYLVVEEWQGTLDLCRRWLAEDDLPRFPLGGGVSRPGAACSKMRP